MRKALLIALFLVIGFCIGIAYATTFSFTYDTATPAGSDDPAEADDRMREIKAAVQERENVDHYWPLTGTEVSDADAGEHRKVTLRTGSAPSAVADKGFVYAKDVGDKAELFYIDEDGNEIQLTSKGQYLANDTNLTATDNAGTGSVNLIKASTSDLAVLSDGAVLAAATESGDGDRTIADKAWADAAPAAQMTPTSYAAEQSITFANGLILKHGLDSRSYAADSTKTITFGTAFPTAIVSASATIAKNNATANGSANALSTTTVLTLSNDGSGGGINIYWQVWGY